MKRGHTKGDIFVLIIVTLMFVSSCTPIGQGTAAQDVDGSAIEEILKAFGYHTNDQDESPTYHPQPVSEKPEDDGIEEGGGQNTIGGKPVPTIKPGEETPLKIGPGIPLYEDPDNLYGDFILHIGKQLLKNAGIPYDEDKARAIAHLTYTEEELQEMYNKANTLIPEGNGGCVPTVGGEGTECPLDDVTATSGNSGNDDGDIIDIDYPTGEDKPTYKG